MKFIADSAYNNNGSVFAGKVSAASTITTMSSEVIPTDLGVTFFRLNKAWDVSEKLAFVSALHRKLEEKFSNGLAAASIAESDCSEEQEFKPFYEGTKAIDLKIMTIHCGFSKNKQNFGAEHWIDAGRSEKIPQALFDIIKPTQEDKTEPKIGWTEYQIELLKLFAETQHEVESKIGVKLPGGRTIGESEDSLGVYRRLEARVRQPQDPMPPL